MLRSKYFNTHPILQPSFQTTGNERYSRFVSAWVLENENWDGCVMCRQQGGWRGGGKEDGYISFYYTKKKKKTAN